MKCTNCKNKIGKGENFCLKCGTPVKSPSGGSAVRILIITGIMLGIIVAVLLYAFKIKMDEKSSTTDNELTANFEDGEMQIAWEELSPSNSIADVPTIDIYAQNHIPAEKTSGMVWDETLFYWFEDIDLSSNEDGYIAKCYITKTIMRNVATGNLIQYEIYRDPNTAQIYKIVSIERVEGGLELCDYYYQNGKPNFIFTRRDSVYTPTYATPDKTGERFYFNNDVMTRWRIISVPKEISEYTLTVLDDVNYQQIDYYAQDADFRTTYDNEEIKMLNAAYNTYNAVSGQTGIGLVEGIVTDTTGSAVAGLTVDVYSKEDNTLLYRGNTGADGRFEILAYLDNTECYIIIYGNDIYKEMRIHGVLLTESNAGMSYNNLIMHKIDGDEYPVYINVYSATEVCSNEDGTLSRFLLPGATVSIRSGAYAYDGKVLMTLEADENGQLVTNLPSGTYTAQIDIPGYAVSYLELKVLEQETVVSGYVMPTIPEDKTGVILTWDGEVDLDLTLFTPYQSTGGDMAHIGADITEDGHGNQLVADNAAGCEVMYVNTADLGSFKLYVNNYSDSLAGNYNSNALSTMNVYIYIYDSTGFVTKYTVPAGQSGVVWEVAEINGNQCTPSNRVYSQIDGKNWWTQNKEKKLLMKKIVSYYNENGVSSCTEWEYEYDNQGNMLSEIGSNTKIEYEYDKDGNKTAEIDYDTDGSVLRKYEYDNMGNVVLLYIYTNGSISTKRERVYDDYGNMLSEIYYNADGSIGAKNEYVYDEQGNKLLEKKYAPDVGIDDTIEYTYDEYGNELSETQYLLANYQRPISYISINSYDNQGNRVVWEKYHKEGNIYSKGEYVYNNRGNMILETYIYYDTDGNESQKSEIMYDDQGNEVSNARYTYGGEDERFEYTYDNKGNMVKEIYYRHGSMVSIWERNYDEKGNLLQVLYYNCSTNYGYVGLCEETEYIYNR